MKLTNKQEKLILSLRTSHGRRKSDLCLCEGVRACSELVSARPETIIFAVRSESFDLPLVLADLEFHVVPDERMTNLSSTVTPQGVIIVAKRPSTSGEISLSDPFSVILDGVADPGNMGTIIRTMRAVGLRSLFLTAGSADPYAPKVVRSAMAAQFAMNIRKFANLAEAIRELRGKGVERFWRCDPHGGIPLFESEEVFANSALILGGEAAGVEEHPETMSVTLPMPGKYESINVAQAATVFLFDAVRRGVLYEH